MIEKPPSVRLADYRDEDAIYDVLVDLHKHNDSGWGFAFRPEIVLERIEAGTRPDPAVRTNPLDLRRGLIGVASDGPGARVIATVGLYLEPPVWFTDVFGLTELWLYVRPEARDQASLRRDLFAFADWAHENLKPKDDLDQPFPFMTGFMHFGPRFAQMANAWKRWSRCEEVGRLYMRR